MGAKERERGAISVRRTQTASEDKGQVEGLEEVEVAALYGQK